VARLPFGAIDQTSNIMTHRLKQEKNYGKGSKNHDRRIGIYYDQNQNLSFDHWIRKYLKDFMGCLFFQEEVSGKSQDFLINICKPFEQIKQGAYNTDVSLLLPSLSREIECAYFDPPYGGQSSDYASLYRFQEEYVWKETLESAGIDLFCNCFVDSKIYEFCFNNILEHSVHIPIWLFSYNDSSWQGIDYIFDFIKKYRTNVKVEVLTGNYQYKYRAVQGNKKKASEYLIIATD